MQSIGYRQCPPMTVRPLTLTFKAGTHVSSPSSSAAIMVLTADLSASLGVSWSWPVYRGVMLPWPFRSTDTEVMIDQGAWQWKRKTGWS